MIWRRLVVPSESTLADLHYAIQIAFAWTDYLLHRFRMRGKEYGIPRRGGPWYSRDARDLQLIDFHFRVNERFLYEYDFTDGWEHQVRIEQFVPPEQTQPYAVCVGGGRAAPPEDCGGPALEKHGEQKNISGKKRVFGCFQSENNEFRELVRL
jgi:hypothetical protein